jgi:hypothetical protein
MIKTLNEFLFLIGKWAEFLACMDKLSDDVSFLAEALRSAKSLRIKQLRLRDFSAAPRATTRPT